MNGDDIEFRKGLMELQRMQNEHILKEEVIHADSKGSYLR